MPARAPERLRRAPDFQAALREGRRARHSLLHVAARRTGEPGTRVGFSISRRVGGAVVRNKVKRRLRMIVRDLPWRDGVDAVFLIQASAASASYEELAEAVTEVLERVRALGGRDR